MSLKENQVKEWLDHAVREIKQRGPNAGPAWQMVRILAMDWVRRHESDRTSELSETQIIASLRRIEERLNNRGY